MHGSHAASFTLVLVQPLDDIKVADHSTLFYPLRLSSKASKSRLTRQRACAQSRGAIAPLLCRRRSRARSRRSHQDEERPI